MHASILAVLIVAFLAGLGSVVDEWEFHQPIVACTLVGGALGHPLLGATLGASLQLVTLGWMNIGTVVGPDPALAAVVAAWWVAGPAQLPVTLGVILALPLAGIGQWLTRGMRQLITPLVNRADVAAANGQLRRITTLQLISAGLQGLRTLLPTALFMLIPAASLRVGYQWLPDVLRGGLNVAAGMIVVVSFAVVISTMATRQLWPFFFLGFALSTDQHLSLVALGLIGVSLAILYLGSQHHTGPQTPAGGGSSASEDDLDRELDDL